MAINDVNNHPSNQTMFRMETLVGKEAISSYVDNVVVRLEEMNPKVATIVKEGGEIFLNKSTNTLTRLKSDNCKVELHDALKHRSDNLIQLIVKLIEQLGTEDAMDIALAEYESGRVDIVNITTKEIIWTKSEFNPKFTKILLRTVVEVMKATSDTETVREAFRCLLSFSTVYKDFRGSNNYILEEEEKAIKRLSSTVYTTNEQFEKNCGIEGTIENDFKHFISRFLKSDNSDDPLFENLCKNFIRTLKKFGRIYRIQFQKYDQHRDSNFSFKSSGTTIRVNGKTKTVPAVIASAFEIDNIAKRPKIQGFDELLGFEGEYGFLHAQGVKSKYRPSISIPQKKLSPRVIHLGENARQDRLGYFHNLISNFLRMYNCDCTFDQSRGVSFILQASGQVTKAVYCMDQSKATDTMLIAAQKLSLGILLSQIFPGEPQKIKTLVEAWADMVSGEENTFYMKNQRQAKYRMIVGQPQGYLSSFASFALLNHFCMLYSLYRYYRRLGIVSVDARHLYRMVGDDSAVMLTNSDENAQFRTDYIDVNRMINVEVNPEKGFSNFGKERTSTTAEFAKVLCINGRYFTPTPFNIASSSANTTPENYLKYLLWIRGKTNHTFSRDRVERLISSKFTLSVEQLRGLDIILSTRTVNNDFYYLCNKEGEYSDVNEEFSYRLTWFNFMNQISKSLCKYSLSYSQNEELLGVQSKGLAAEEMMKEIKFFKHLEKDFDISQIPKGSKLYREYSYDFVKKELFPIIKENSTEDLISIVQESEILTDYLLEHLDRELSQISENMESIDQIALDGPEYMDEARVEVVKKVTPLLSQRSWSLNNYQIDTNYLKTIGQKLGKFFLSFANEKFGTSFDTSGEDNVNEQLDKTIDINYDLGIEFIF